MVYYHEHTDILKTKTAGGILDVSSSCDKRKI